jgi:hypothetical protein
LRKAYLEDDVARIRGAMKSTHIIFIVIVLIKFLIALDDMIFRKQYGELIIICIWISCWVIFYLIQKRSTFILLKFGEITSTIYCLCLMEGQILFNLADNFLAM